MQRHSLHCAVLASALCLTACAGYGPYGTEATAFRDKTLSMQAASAAVIPGTSTKADVTAALGSAAVVSFDSGYEVWLYREKTSRPVASSPEFVILFDPAGIVKKARIRPAYDLSSG